MTFLLTLWAVLSLDALCKDSTANLDQCLDDITPPKLRTPLHLLVQHVSQPVCHWALGLSLPDYIQVIGNEAKLNSQFRPFGRYWGKCNHQHSERHEGGWKTVWYYFLTKWIKFPNWYFFKKLLAILAIGVPLQSSNVHHTMKTNFFTYDI